MEILRPFHALEAAIAFSLKELKNCGPSEITFISLSLSLPLSALLSSFHLMVHGFLVLLQRIAAHVALTPVSSFSH